MGASAQRPPALGASDLFHEVSMASAQSLLGPRPVQVVLFVDAAQGTKVAQHVIRGDNIPLQPPRERESVITDDASEDLGAGR